MGSEMCIRDRPSSPATFQVTTLISFISFLTEEVLLSLLTSVLDLLSTAFAFNLSVFPSLFIKASKLVCLEAFLLFVL